jgi:hypothetical protein
MQHIALDAGVWSGSYVRYDPDTHARTSSGPFATPMVGLSYFVGFSPEKPR